MEAQDKDRNSDHRAFWLAVGVTLLATMLLAGLATVAQQITGTTTGWSAATWGWWLAAISGASVVTSVTAYLLAWFLGALCPQVSFWRRARAVVVPVAVVAFPGIFALLMGVA